MFGLVIVEFYIKENGKEYKFVFFGDLGNRNVFILKDFVIIDGCDYLFIESIYGNRFYVDVENKFKKFIDIISIIILNGGKVIILFFVVGRIQEILYEIVKEISIDFEEVKIIRNVEIFVDSLFVIFVIVIYKKYIDYFDVEVVMFIKNGIYFFEFFNLRFIKFVDEFKWLNEYDKSCIIIFLSGMCEVGRIKYYFKYNLWNEKNIVFFVGYQVLNMLGRRFLDGQKKVKIFGEEVEVRVKIEYIEVYFGYVDKSGFFLWIEQMSEKLKKIFVVYGEKEVQFEFVKEF